MSDPAESLLPSAVTSGLKTQGRSSPGAAFAYEAGGETTKKVDALLDSVIRFALKKQPVQLSNGSESPYYVDMKQALTRPDVFHALGHIVADHAHSLNAEAVGGLTMGADPVAFSALAVPQGADLVAFVVRKERKKHGLQKWVEGSVEHRMPCLVVDDVVTTGASTVDAINRLKTEGFQVVGALAVVDRLAGARNRIEKACEGAPFASLLTIDEIYPDRPDRA